MTTVATRTREIDDLEGFDIQITKDGAVVDTRINGLAKYPFDRKLKGTATVAQWKTQRFEATYPGYDCRVLYGDGREANGNATLNTVRESYEGD
jgi:hypothetical protein